MQKALEQIAKDEKEARLYEAFGLLGDHVREAEVEFALPAQREVLNREIGSNSARYR